VVGQALGNWIKLHRTGRLKGASGKHQVTAEQMEISRLRAELARVTMEQNPRRILERSHEVYKRPKYARLATISVAHLYNLRHHQRYRERLLNYTRTRPTAVSIAEQRKPQPQGQPRLLRLDTERQGDQPNGGEKGVYQVNAFDEVTQWQGLAQRRASRRPIWSRFRGLEIRLQELELPPLPVPEVQVDSVQPFRVVSDS
jgi:hypothetical protein